MELTRIRVCRPTVPMDKKNKQQHVCSRGPKCQYERTLCQHAPHRSVERCALLHNSLPSTSQPCRCRRWRRWRQRREGAIHGDRLIVLVDRKRMGTWKELRLWRPCGCRRRRVRPPFLSSLARPLTLNLCVFLLSAKQRACVWLSIGAALAAPFAAGVSRVTVCATSELALL